MQTKIDIKVIGKEEMGDIEPLWRALEENVESPALVCTWNWVSTWIETYGDIVDYWFCLGFSGKKLIGITLVTKETKRWLPIPVSAYHIGTQGEPLKDWIHMVNNNVLTLEGYTSAFTRALTKTLIHQFNWEECLIDDANQHFASEVVKAAKHYPITTKKVTHTSYFVDLKSMRKQGKTAMESFSRDTRYQIKRNMKEFGELTAEYAETIEEARDIFAELQKLHQLSLTKKGKRGSYSSERFIKFHETLLEKIFATGSIILYRVRSERLGTLGCFYLFNDNGTAFGYSSGMADFTDVEISTINKKRLKPGFVMHALCMQECLNRGINEYNFSTGSEGYKQELTSDTTTIVTVKLQRSYKAKLREVFYEKYLKAEEKQQFQLLLKPLYSAYLFVTK